MKTASGHTAVEWEAKKREAYQKNIVGALNDFITLTPGDLVVPKDYLKYQEKVYNFKYKPTDVVIMTYSKCGTTWMQEIIWTMLNNPNLDNPMANLPLFARSPFMESDMLFGANADPNDEMMKKVSEVFKMKCPGANPAEGIQIQLAGVLPDRRSLKTHLPFSMHNPTLLDTAKVIFVARNPKDACLSFQHHHKVIKIHNFVGSQDQFVDYFVDGDLIFGSFHGIINEAWAKRDHPNMHFIFFEDLKADIDGELKKIDKFIGSGLSDAQLKNVKEYTSFSSMKARDPMSPEKDKGKMLNTDLAQKDGGFFRKGVSGGWREKLTKEQSDKIDAYVKKYMDPTGITFKY